MFANFSSGTEHRDPTLYQDLSAVNASKPVFVLHLPFLSYALGRLWGLETRKTHTYHNGFFYIPNHRFTKSKELKFYFMPEKKYSARFIKPSQEKRRWNLI